jgi:hypothetical protein
MDRAIPLTLDSIFVPNNIADSLPSILWDNHLIGGDFVVNQLFSLILMSAENTGSKVSILVDGKLITGRPVKWEDTEDQEPSVASFFNDIDESAKSDSVMLTHVTITGLPPVNMDFILVLKSHISAVSLLELKP